MTKIFHNLEIANERFASQIKHRRIRIFHQDGKCIKVLQTSHKWSLCTKGKQKSPEKYFTQVCSKSY